MKNERNLTINGLRGFSSFIVVLAHVYGMAVAGGFFAERGNSILGDVGVNLFFMISGFLIIQSLNNHGNFKVFMMNRFVRIYPVFLTLHLMIFAAGPVIKYEWFKEIDSYGYTINFFSNLFFLPGIFDLPLAQKNAWSLSYEFLFYIVASLFFVVRGLSTRNLMLSALTVLTLVIIGFRPLALFFVVGTTVFYLLRNKPLVGTGTFAKYNGLLWLVLLFIAYNINLYLCIVPAFLFFISIVKEEGLTSSVLRTKPFQFLGDISYSLYLWHPFAFFPLKMVFARAQPYIGNEYLALILFGITGTLLALLLSHLSYKFIEVKFTNAVLKNKVRSERRELIKVEPSTFPTVQ